MLKAFLAAALDVVFPPLCHVCRACIPDAGELHICPACLERMPPIRAPLCVICGIPFIGAGDSHTCGSCCTTHPRFDSARAALGYEGAARDLIHAFKYRNKTHLRRPLGLLMIRGLSEFILAGRHDLIMPVPLHRKKLSSRGFNQALLLSEILSHQLQIALDRHNLRRIRWTEPQVNLAAADRKANVKGAFAIHEPALVRGHRVLLVDDVLTTGSTVEECAGTVKGAGAAGVTVITVARALV
ncbi:MAG: ComF family protein [Desulfuromonadales bacterium]|nr:ComF family protein [Desulfuromonadales bacterium]